MATLLAFLVLLALFTAALFWLVPRLTRAATSTTSSVRANITQLYVAANEMREIASYPTDSAIRINVKGASVKVKREGAAGRIVISANHPVNWKNSEGTLSQVETADADKIGSSATLKLVKVVSLSREPVDPARVQIIGADILVDGRKVSVIFDGDELEVVVPEAHRGDLIIFNEGTDEVNIERWVGGKVELTSTDSADFTGGELTELESFKVEMSDNGAVRFDRVEAAVFDVRQNNGNIEVPTVTSTKTLKLTVEGTGDIDISDALNVEEGVIELPSGSNCNTTAGAVTCKNLTVNSHGPGNCEFDSVSGGTLKASFADSSSFTVNNRISVETFEFVCEDGSGDFTCEEIYATSSTTIKLTPSSNCNVDITTINSPKTNIESLGQGNVDVDDCEGTEFVGAFDQDSYFTVENRLSASRTSIEMRGSGDASICELKSTEVTVVSHSNANVTISDLRSETAYLTNEGEGTIDVEDGSGARLTLTTHNGGDINICGDFSSVSTNKSGSGTISL